MFISPMLLQIAVMPFSDDNYIFEPKIDGHRLILSRMNGETRLYTRHNNEVTRQYPELWDVGVDDIILDGEVACVDSTGAICFESVMERFSARKSDTVQRLSQRLPANYIVFDILRFKGKDLRGLSLAQRKDILAGIDFSNPRIGIIPYIQENGEVLFEEILAKKLEGMVAKRINSIYVSNRSEAWLKIINWKYEEVYISGYRKKDFGWLASVPDDSRRMRPAGIIEFGVTPQHKMAFYGICKSLINGEDNNNVYLEPRIRAKVKIRNWTKAGMLRSPVFVDFVL